jgi:tripartite-type tricarboxylate transporter receptor subunit TctC
VAGAAADGQTLLIANQDVIVQPIIKSKVSYKLEYGIDITHVPFQGAAAAVQSVLAGQTPIFHNVLPAVAPHIRQGTMRALAVAAAKRSPLFPDVPTLAEAGIPGHEVGFWIVVLAPAGMPQATVDVLNRHAARILELPDVKERLQSIGFDPASSTPDAAAAHMKAETDKWTKVVRDAKIRID